MTYELGSPIGDFNFPYRGFLKATDDVRVASIMTSQQFVVAATTTCFTNYVTTMIYCSYFYHAPPRTVTAKS